MFTRRPKPGDDDDELLKFQNEFQQQTSTPAAKVVRVGETSKPNDEDPAENMETEGSIQLIIGPVTERKQTSEATNPSGIKQPTGFPAVRKLDPSEYSGQDKASDAKKPKKSLFAMNMARQKAAKQKKAAPVPAHSADNKSSPTLKANIRDIEQENIDKLSRMTLEEIEDERRQLLQSLDPKLISILKSRQHRQKTIPNETAAIKRDIVTPIDLDTQPSTSSQSSYQPGSSKSDENPMMKPEDVMKGLPVKPDPRWLNMDKLETDKLAWIVSKPPVEQSDTGTQKKPIPRFSFGGKIIDPEQPDTSIDDRYLYHHGEESNRPGYTLEELYTLCRSLNQSQKVVALTTLSNIIRNAQSGLLRLELNTALIPLLLDSDICILLRYSLDDKSELVMSAAVDGFHSLIVNQHDKKLLSACKYGYNSHIIPEYTVIDNDEPRSEEELAEREQEQYIELLRRDVIAGLLEMDVLPRFRYILDVMSPQPNVAVMVLEILSRIASTCREICYKLTRTPHLLDTIFNKYLNTTPSESTTSCSEAMGLLRVICSSGRTQSKLMVDRGIMDKVLRYLSDDNLNCSLNLTVEESNQLQIESISLWRTLLSYGLTCDTFVSYFTTIVMHISSDRNILTAAYICLCEAALHAASAFTQLKKSSKVKFSLDSEHSVEEHAHNESIINWSHVSGLLYVIWLRTRTHMESFTSDYIHQHTDYNLDLLITTLNFISSYMVLCRLQPVHSEHTYNIDSVVEELVDLLDRGISSMSFDKLIVNSRANSIYLNEDGFYTSESPPRLPSLNSLSCGEDVVNTYNIEPLVVFQAILRVIKTSLKYQPGKIMQLMVRLMLNTELKTYLKKLRTNRKNNSSNYFIHIESTSFSLFGEILTQLSFDPLEDLYETFLAVLPCYNMPSLMSLHSVLNAVIFHQDFIKTISAHRSLKPTLSEFVKELPSVCSLYVDMILPRGPEFNQARHQASRDVISVQTLYTPHKPGSILPIDWIYLPLLLLYQQSNSTQAADSDSAGLPENSGFFARLTLRFIYLLQKLHPAIIDVISPAARLSRVMSVYMIDASLFLENDIKFILDEILTDICIKPDNINFKMNIPGLQSFTDFYSHFTVQFEAASFCDKTFSRFLLLPLMQSQPVKLRTQIWSDHPVALRCIQLRHNELPVSMSYYLNPEETNLTLIQLMSRSLLQGVVTPTRNEALYIISLHHVNRFMFTTTPEHRDIKQSLLKAAKHCTVDPVGHHLTHYKEYASDVDDGIVCFNKLPDSRLKTLNNVV